MAKILVVEDDPSCATFVQTWLSSEGHDISLATDGDVALKLLLADQFDLVLLDWNLPKVSGVDLLGQYRNLGNRTPVIMLTGRSDIDDKEMGLDIGADDYLAKPFNLVELSARIRALLRRQARVSVSPVLPVQPVQPVSLR